MPPDTPETGRLPLARMRRETTAFEIVPDAQARRALAGALGLSDLRKLRLAGEISPEGARDWVLEATLGATVVQPCIVTLAPVTTRIDEPVVRRYTDADEPAVAPGEEVEMPEDDTREPLPEMLDLTEVLAEALALAVPQYPRIPGAEPGEMRAAPAGVRPLEDADMRPFAGLAALRDRLEDGEEG